MSTTVRCRECHALIATGLSWLTTGTPLGEEDGQPHLPLGGIVTSDGGCFPDTEGQLVISLGDAIGTRQHHLLGRLNGCCGLDGCDGLNILCSNGHEVGTEKSDCWMPHALLLDPQKVDVENT